MSSRRRRSSLLRATSIPLAVSVAVASIASAAFAPHHAGKGKITPVLRSNKGATNLAKAIFEGNKALVRAKWVMIPPGGTPAAISTKHMAGFPGRGRAFAILTTGCALLADNPNNAPDTGCRDGGVKFRGARDVTIWRIRVVVPKDRNCLSFRFKFLSEEYPEFINSIYNDAFIAELSRFPSWDASGTQTPTITAPGDFATTRDGNLISVNGTNVARVNRKAARGTTYDAATGKLRASTPVKPGVHLLHLSIFDQSDRMYDSAVFIDRLTLTKAKHCRSGVVRY